MKSKDEYWACKKMMRADYYGGGGSGSVVGPDPVTPLEAIKQRAEKLGIEVVNYTTKESMNAMNDSEVALGVDQVLVFAATTAVESIDRPSLKLDDHADDLILRFAKLAP